MHLEEIWSFPIRAVSAKSGCNAAHPSGSVTRRMFMGPNAEMCKNAKHHHSPHYSFVSENSYCSQNVKV